MGNKDDFDFDDDFSFDDDEFDLGEDLPGELGEEEDLPDLEDEEESSGPNRTFVVIAGIMILLFVVGLAAVLYLATRPTPPSPRQLTSDAVVLLNQTVQAQLFQTQTQASIFANMTQTASAFTATPTITPTATFPPTVTPTPTLDATSVAGTAIAAQLFAAQTAAALQLQQPGGPVPLEQAFATQVANATAQGVAAVGGFATQAAVATQGVLIGVAGTPVALDATSTQVALDLQVPNVVHAAQAVETAFAERAAGGGAFSTRVIEVTPPAAMTQSALATPAAAATQAAIGTQAVFSTLQVAANAVATQVVDVTLAAEENPLSPQTQLGLETQIAVLPTQLAQVNAAVGSGTIPLSPEMASTQAAVGGAANQIATSVAVITQAAQASPVSPQERADVEAQIANLPAQVAQANFAGQMALATQVAQVNGVGQIAFATQQAFSTPAALSTAAAMATQADLALRADLVRQALAAEVVVVPTETGTPGQGGGVSADAVALTATALANLLAPTQELFTPVGPITTPFAPLPTELPQTGFFEDVVGGGRNGLGMIALAVVGLLGVIVISRRLRRQNDKKQ